MLTMKRVKIVRPEDENLFYFDHFKAEITIRYCMEMSSM